MLLNQVRLHCFLKILRFILISICFVGFSLFSKRDLHLRPDDILMMESGRKSVALPTGSDWRLVAAEYVVRHLIISGADRQAFFSWLLNVPKPITLEAMNRVLEMASTVKSSHRRYTKRRAKGHKRDRDRDRDRERNRDRNRTERAGRSSQMLKTKGRAQTMGHSGRPNGRNERKENRDFNALDPRRKRQSHSSQSSQGRQMKRRSKTFNKEASSSHKVVPGLSELSKSHVIASRETAPKRTSVGRSR